MARHISDLPPEQEAIRARCFHPRGSFRAFTSEELEQSIPERFWKIVKMHPDRLAVKMGPRSLTYDGLNRAANCIASAIMATRGGKQEPVVLLFEQGIQALTAVLAVLKTAKFYVPLDPWFPLDRIASVIDDSEANLIVTNSENIGLVRQLKTAGTRVLDVDAIDTSVSSEDLSLSLSPDIPACVLYTSGSTGEPKGVVQNHRSLMHRAMIYTNLLHICLSDRLTLLHSYSVGSCIHHLFASLLNGASIFPFDPRSSGGLRLARWLIQERISVYHSGPTLFRQMAAEMTGEEKFAHLRAINVSGAPMTSSDVELYVKHFPAECCLLHMMGSTETGWIRHFFLDKSTPITRHVVPVGYPIENKNVTLRAENGQNLGVDEIGEIAVESRYLSSSYWRKPELTQSKFLSSPDRSDRRVYLTGDLGRMLPDGCLLHLGRKDFQVKVRGYRIEVGEIEALLMAQGTVREAAVIKGERTQTDDERLIAYVVPEGEARPTISTLQLRLRDKFPSYMIPSKFVFRDALPLTPNGKVDRRALPEPDHSRPQLDVPFVAPRTAVEEGLVKIWAEVLSLYQVGIHDNFFDLGGHSLSATRIASQITEEFRLELPLKSLFEFPTVAQTAALITEMQARADREYLTCALDAVESLTDQQAERLLAKASAEKKA